MTKAATAPKTKPVATKTVTEPPRKETNRDFVEQIVVAFILAFLVRGFEAEAFVIPTGSMAPTLAGRHKEVTCRQCGETYSVNASEEPDSYARRPGPPPMETAVCPNCRYREKNLAEAPNFKGDRILVNKFLYDLSFLPGAGGPRRWDVVVFHYPEEPETNYIKRCVGLPNEEIRIDLGNILVRPFGSSEPFRLVRRPLYHQLAMQMPVYDDSHRPKAFKDFPQWRRWQSESWKEPTEGTFVSEGSSGGHWNELRYQHLVPDPAQWEAALTGSPIPGKPRPMLVTDLYGYNTGETLYPFRDPDTGDYAYQAPRNDWYQPHWVGDLTLSCRVETTEAKGSLRFELVEGGITNRCEVDLATGLATLYHGDTPLGAPVKTPLSSPGAYDVTFANVDDRLTLWVDGTMPFGDGTMPFGDGVAYGEGTERHSPPTAADLAPAAVATRGAGAKVSGLVLRRDIYYTQTPGTSDYRAQFGSLDPSQFTDPSRFASLVDIPPKDYPIRPGHYMMLGDNSPRSKDSRGWSREDRNWDPNDRESWEVPESLLIGKAFYVYWPHGQPFGPDIRLSRDFRVPFRPYVERMKWIR